VTTEEYVAKLAAVASPTETIGKHEDVLYQKCVKQLLHEQLNSRGSEAEKAQVSGILYNLRYMYEGRKKDAAAAAVVDVQRRKESVPLHKFRNAAVRVVDSARPQPRGNTPLVGMVGHAYDHYKSEVGLFLESDALVRTKVVAVDNKLVYDVGRAPVNGVCRYVLAHPPGKFGLDLAQEPLLYVDTGDISFKHSMFLKGLPIRCGGMLMAVSGESVEYSNGSGHYCPPPDTLVWVTQWMIKNGVDLKDVNVNSGSIKVKRDEFTFMDIQSKLPGYEGYRSHAHLLKTMKAFDGLGVVKKRLIVGAYKVPPA